MAVCNVFNDLINKTGTFLTFSSYMEDLTKQDSQSTNYRVVPSKFIAIYLEQPDKDIPKSLMYGFENAYAYFKNSERDDNQTKSLFWDTMLGLNGDYYKFIKDDASNIHFMGDINMHSYNDHDGMCYSEIYCYIPNDASKQKFNIESNNDAYINTNEILPAGTSLVGFDDEEYKLPYNTTYKTYTNYIDRLTRISDSSNDNFEFNSVIVLYDIYSDGELKVQNLPMGIYFTGIVEEDGTIGNSIIKYAPNTANQDEYLVGTSYGLRICYRYATNALSPVFDITIDNNYDDMCRVLSQISVSQNKMDDIINRTYMNSQNYKDLLAIFKNNRTNVPYIKNIDGKNYWFVNGKLVQQAEYDDAYHMDSCITLDVVIDNNIISFESAKNLDKIKLSWSVYSGDVKLEASNIKIDGKDISDTDLQNGYTYIKFDTSELDLDDTTKQKYIINYKIEAEVDEYTASKDITIVIVRPSYWYVGGEFDLSKSNEVLLENKSFTTTYSNNNNSHVYFAYPYSFGELTSITDSRDLEYINDFGYEEHEINNINYYIYTDKHPACVKNYTLKFK